MIEEIIEVKDLECIVVVGVCGVLCLVISFFVLVDVFIVEDVEVVVFIDMNNVFMIFVFFYFVGC